MLGTHDATKSLVIDGDLAYAQTVQQFETTDLLTLSSIREVDATVSSIGTSEHDETYDTLIISVSEVRVTPETSTQADEWNSMEYGGVTTWTPGVTQTFSSAHPGEWEFGSVWLDHVAVSMRREGDLLNVNERGGFDGQDPPEDVYFLED